jgi:hypothetical protein
MQCFHCFGSKLLEVERIQPLYLELVRSRHIKNQKIVYVSGFFTL